jgi:hypothetical protein
MLFREDDNEQLRSVSIYVKLVLMDSKMMQQDVIELFY